MALSSQVGARIVMRIIGAGLCLACLLAASAFARAGGHAGGGGHASSGFRTGAAGSGFRSGGGGFRGGGGSRGYNNGYSRGAFGRSRPGYRYGFGLGFYNPWLWNYGYPYYGDPYDYSSSAPGYPDQYPDQNNYIPPVVINQDFQPDRVAPLVREYPGPPPQ